MNQSKKAGFFQFKLIQVLTIVMCIREKYGELQVKPDAVDNEAIEELVNRLLNSDLTENGKEQKLNKEAEKLINSSNYWNTDNLLVSPIHI